MPGSFEIFEHFEHSGCQAVPGARQFINATTGGENILIKMS